MRSYYMKATKYPFLNPTISEIKKKKKKDFKSLLTISYNIFQSTSLSTNALLVH